MIWNLRRISRHSRPDSRSRSRPSCITLPSAPLISPSKVRPRVVFPHPDSPTSPRNSPGMMSKSTPSMASAGPALPLPGYRTFRSRTIRNGSTSCWEDVLRTSRGSVVMPERADIASSLPPRKSATTGNRSPGLCSDGRQDSRARVYGCDGVESSISVGPDSTISPRYMTATLSAMSATTPRSWVMKSTDMPLSRCSSLISERMVR